MKIEDAGHTEHKGGAGSGHIGGGGPLSAEKLQRIARQFKNLSDLFDELAATPIGEPVPTPKVAAKEEKK